jgi:hypothetical protein
MLPRPCPAAADACSSLRPSRAAASPSIVARRRQERSGSTPHDDVTADPPPKRHQPFAPDLDRHRPRLCRPVRLARIASSILVNKPPVRSFSPPRTPAPWAKAMGSTTSRHTLRARRPAQFPIEPAAPPVPHPPRFRALALFGRRPPERVDRLGIRPGLISTKSSMPDNVAQSTSNSISGSGYSTRQRWRGSDSTEKWSRTEADGARWDMRSSESSKPPMNHILSASAGLVNLKRLPWGGGDKRDDCRTHFPLYGNQQNASNMRA